MSVQEQVQGNVSPLVVADQAAVARDIGLVSASDMKVASKAKAVDPALEKVADDWVSDLLKVDLTSAEGGKQARAAVENVGVSLQQKLAKKSAMLKQQISTLAGSADGSPVANALVGLKVQVDQINPNKFKLLEPGSLGRAFQWVPGVGTSLNKYFTKWQSAGGVIDSIVANLHGGVDQLRRDIDILSDDQVEMRSLTLRLQKTIATAMLLDKKLSEAIAAMAADDERRKILEEEVLFALRQRTNDLLQNLAVNQQGVLTYEIIIRNNRELIRGAERCENVTIKALEIAVVAALALANQRVVLKTIQAVDTTTENLLMQNAAMLKSQGVEIHKMAAGQSLKMDSLKKCFADITGALDDIARFKQEALPQMAARIVEADQMAGEVEKRIIKMERGNAQRPVITLDLEPTSGAAA